MKRFNSIIVRFWLAALLVGFAISNRALAKEVRFNDIVLDVLDAQKIIVTGYRGTLKLLPSKQAGKIVIHARKIIDDKKQTAEDTWTFGAKHEDKNIRIEVRGNEDPRQSTTEFNFEIEAPQLAFDISWRDGTVLVSNWTAALNVVLLEGQLNLSHCSASVNVQNESGEVRISNHKGRVEIDALKSKLYVTDFDGHLRIKNFSGESSLENVSASVRIQSKLGISHIAKSQGSLEIENGKGALNISDFSGQIRGQNEDGSITAKILGDVDVSLESLGGSMSFKLPESSAAFAKLQTEDGTLNAPESFKTGKLGGLKVASGRLPGTERGSILLKSKSGNLRVH